MRLGLVTIATFLTAGVPEVALAADGTMGALSSGTVVIRVTVAPRAWSADASTLCVAAPPGGYSISQDSGAPVAVAPSSISCPGRAQAVTLAPTLVREGSTILIVAE